MKKFKTDLHIHSCLSPCGDLDMSPRRIVEKCRERGLDIIALCDHNSAENVEPAIRVGEALGIRVLPGMEINSKEEVHTLAIFGQTNQAFAMQDIVYGSLTGVNRPEFFGEQVRANEFDEVEGFNDRLLIGAVDLGLEEIVREIHRLGGLCIASHVDRPSYSLISQLGFVPPGVYLDAVEVSDPRWAGSEGRGILETLGLPVVTSSDAHFLKDIGRRVSVFFMETATVEELRLALLGKSGRSVEM
ncbi:MAG: PHP domain-containing protein [Deltaproteobacteria bacterium]|nr:PHP domain-containing protein [Deltaproteobacteria bacterium]